VDDAVAMLRELGGRAHTVLSGLCLIGPAGEIVDHAETLVTFRQLSDRVIREYVGSGEWRGRAGGYAIQGLGGRLVERIEGDYSNVVGLPAALLLTTLERELPDVLGT
jgi:septum formation protein